MMKMVNVSLTIMLVALLMLVVQTFPPTTVNATVNGTDGEQTFMFRGMQCMYSDYYTHDVCFPPSDNYNGTNDGWTHCNEDEITFLWKCYPIDDLFPTNESYNWFIELWNRYDSEHYQ